MSLQIKSGSRVPKETERVARAAFPKGNPYVTLRDELETLYHDNQFVRLCFLNVGSPPNRLGGWQSSPFCSLLKTCRIGRLRMLFAVGLIGNTCWAWNWRIPGSIFRY